VAPARTNSTWNLLWTIVIAITLIYPSLPLAADATKGESKSPTKTKKAIKKNSTGHDSPAAKETEKQFRNKPESVPLPEFSRGETGKVATTRGLYGDAKIAEANATDAADEHKVSPLLSAAASKAAAEGDSTQPPPFDAVIPVEGSVPAILGPQRQPDSEWPKPELALPNEPSQPNQPGMSTESPETLLTAPPQSPPSTARVSTATTEPPPFTNPPTVPAESHPPLAIVPTSPAESPPAATLPPSPDQPPMAATLPMAVAKPSAAPQPAAPVEKADGQAAFENDALDQIRLEIKRRLTFFQSCADASRRRGGNEVHRLQATWSVAADGTIKMIKFDDVADPQLATCITRAGSRPFSIHPGVELTIPTPIVFVK
jgi:hypothetical protein